MADLITDLSRIKTACSVSVLALLLAWEAWTPFFAYFAGAAGERTRHGLKNLALGVLNASVTGLLITPFLEVARTRPPEDTEVVSEFAACPPATLARKSRAHSRTVRQSQ